MPAAIRAHLRYPRRLFATQATVVARFHVQDPAAFARGEDAWRLAEDTFDARLDAGPYYALVRPPGQASKPSPAAAAADTSAGRQNDEAEALGSTADTSAGRQNDAQPLGAAPRASPSANLPRPA